MFFLLLLQIVFGREIVQIIRIGTLIISHLILIGKFGTQDSEHIVYGGVFQIRLFDQILLSTLLAVLQPIFLNRSMIHWSISSLNSSR